MALNWPVYCLAQLFNNWIFVVKLSLDLCCNFIVGFIYSFYSIWNPLILFVIKKTTLKISKYISRMFYRIQNPEHRCHLDYQLTDCYPTSNLYCIELFLQPLCFKKYGFFWKRRKSVKVYSVTVKIWKTWIAHISLFCDYKILSLQ